MRPGLQAQSRALVALACASCGQVITESVFQTHAVLDADLRPSFCVLKKLQAALRLGLLFGTAGT